MASPTEGTSVKLGFGALIAGVLSAFGSFMIYGSSTFLNPPEWTRIPTMALFPLGALASLLLGSMAFAGRGRGMAIAGWIASLIAVALFVYAITTLG
ncbi:hypothetical protein FDZ71_00800 [bacterium]|nr:MAG: hypothetical protein FDZ71_00800 [bacterium]